MKNKELDASLTFLKYGFKHLFHASWVIARQAVRNALVRLRNAICKALKAIGRMIVFSIIEAVGFIARHKQASAIVILAVINVILIGCVVQKTMRLNTSEHECYLLEERLDSARMQNFHYVKY